MGFWKNVFRNLPSHRWRSLLRSCGDAFCRPSRSEREGGKVVEGVVVVMAGVLGRREGKGRPALGNSSPFSAAFLYSEF